jgi:hypothetical protein
LIGLRHLQPTLYRDLVLVEEQLDVRAASGVP